MGEEVDIYFEVDKMLSEKTEADPSLERTMPAVMEAAANDTVKKWKSKGVTTKKPNDKKAKGYVYGGTLTSLKIDDGVMIAVVNMVLTSWPKRTLVAGGIVGRYGESIRDNPTEKQLSDAAEKIVTTAVTKITDKTLQLVVKEQP